MTKEVYLTLEDHLNLNVPALKLVDYDLQQYAQESDAPVTITPAAYIGYTSIQWSTHNRYIQRGVFTFTVTLVNQTAYGDGQDITDTQFINHLAIERAIYVALHGRRFHLSDVPGIDMTGLTDQVIIESIERVGNTPHDSLDSLVITRQVFRCNVWDYSAVPEYTSQLAGLQLEVEVNAEL